MAESGSPLAESGSPLTDSAHARAEFAFAATDPARQSLPSAPAATDSASLRPGLFRDWLRSYRGRQLPLATGTSPESRYLKPPGFGRCLSGSARVMLPTSPPH